jgi:hypothetical protein
MVDAAFNETHSRQKRLRDLPSRMIVYLLIAACLFPDIGYTDLWAKLGAKFRPLASRGTSASALSQASRRIGRAPMRWLFELLRSPEGATPQRRGVRWKNLPITGLNGCRKSIPTDLSRP